MFGGRRPRMVPLVYESFNWQHGVFVGATMASERTAAQIGKLGEVRRDPMAMLPFCGYDMAKYWQHWLEIGKRIPKPPKIFHVNWFRQNDQGKFLWPGFGENMRVLEWILGRCTGQAKAVESPVGYMPTPADINTQGLDIDAMVMKDLLTIRPADWKAEIDSQGEFFGQFPNCPAAIKGEYEGLKKRMGM